MKVRFLATKNPSLDTLDRCASALHLAANLARVRLVRLRIVSRQPHCFRFRLGLITPSNRTPPPPWQRVTYRRVGLTGSMQPHRKVGAVCWHGHNAFYAALFSLAHVRVYTHLANFAQHEYALEATNGPIVESYLHPVGAFTNENLTTLLPYTNHACWIGQLRYADLCTCPKETPR